MGYEFRHIRHRGWSLVELPEGDGYATKVDAARALMAEAEAHEQKMKAWRKDHTWHEWVFSRPPELDTLFHYYEAKSILNRIENECLPRKQRTSYKKPRKLDRASDRFAVEQDADPVAKHRHRTTKCLPYRVVGKIIKENAT